MVSFSVNGQALDMPAGLSLQFQRKNILFAFDSIQVERTTNFSIPATPNNMRIFGFANSHLTSGEDMRVKIPATLTYGVLTKSGVLHISKYNVKNKTFECVDWRIGAIKARERRGQFIRILLSSICCSN